MADLVELDPTAQVLENHFITLVLRGHPTDKSDQWNIKQMALNT